MSAPLSSSVHSNCLVILPSYNESGNILRLIEAIHKLGSEYSVCVVDDNSPDGTSPLVAKYRSELSGEMQTRLHLITRSKKDGRGGAVRAGLQWGLEQPGLGKFVEMDCDFSHPPESIPEGARLLDTHDAAMGCRYPDGKIVGWPLSRRLLSFCSNLLARFMISYQIADYTNGFRFYSRKAAVFLCSKEQKYKGYIYLSECISHMLRAKMQIACFPIVFVNRTVGQSNTTMKEVFNSLKGIFAIAWDYRFGRTNS